jgi:sporulation protein YlmC with PRC-barrel domain
MEVIVRTIAIAAVSALLLSGTATLAQTSSSPGSPGVHPVAPGSPPAKMAAPSTTPNPLNQEDISKIEGKSVYGTDRSSLGSITTVLMNPQKRTIDRLVIESGGVLGVGAHRYAVPLDKFTWDAQRGGFIVGMDEKALKSQPEWVEGANPESGSSPPPATTVHPNAGASSDTKSPRADTMSH